MISQVIDQLKLTNPDKLKKFEDELNADLKCKKWHLDLTGDDLRLEKAFTTMPELKLKEHQKDGQILAVSWFENNCSIILPCDLKVAFYNGETKLDSS